MQPGWGALQGAGIVVLRTLYSWGDRSVCTYSSNHSETVCPIFADEVASVRVETHLRSPKMASREASMTGMAALRSTLYNTVMRRNSAYVTACVLGGYVFTHAYLSGTDSVWKSINKGVS